MHWDSRVSIKKLLKQPSFRIQVQFSVLPMYWKLLNLPLSNFSGGNLTKKQLGKSYKDFYTLGQIYKPVLKNEKNALIMCLSNNKIKLKNPK